MRAHEFIFKSANGMYEQQPNLTIPDIGNDINAGDDWEQETSVDTDKRIQRANYSDKRGLNLSIDADNPIGPRSGDERRGVRVGYGPASLSLSGQGSVTGAYNLPLDTDSSVSVSASGKQDQGLQNVGLQFQKGDFSAGINKSTNTDSKPYFNVGWSKRF